MIKGTTPNFTFELPYQVNELKEIEVLISYGISTKKELLQKTKEDCELNGNIIAVTLTEEETLKIPAPSIMEIQLRVKTQNDMVQATEIYEIKVSRLLTNRRIGEAKG